MNTLACLAPSSLASSCTPSCRPSRDDALRAALVAEVAARAVPDAVGAVEVPQAVALVAVADVADEPVGLGQRGRPEEVGVGLHRVALGDAAAAHDAQRLLRDLRLLLGRDAPLGGGRLG